MQARAAQTKMDLLFRGKLVWSRLPTNPAAD